VRNDPPPTVARVAGREPGVAAPGVRDDVQVAVLRHPGPHQDRSGLGEQILGAVWLALQEPVDVGSGDRDAPAEVDDRKRFGRVPAAALLGGMAPVEGVVPVRVRDP
jgi:hypothetical protein